MRFNDRRWMLVMGGALGFLMIQVIVLVLLGGTSVNRAKTPAPKPAPVAVRIGERDNVDEKPDLQARVQALEERCLFLENVAFHHDENADATSKSVRAIRDYLFSQMQPKTIYYRFCDLPPDWKKYLDRQANFVCDRALNTGQAYSPPP